MNDDLMMIQILGAYCSGCWASRNQMNPDGERTAYFGDGHTFLFKVDGSNLVKYDWVDLNASRDAGASGDAGLSKRERHARELFITGKHDCFAVGGG